LNADSDEEREPLLTGDFNEESRMKDRLSEKKSNATSGSVNIAEEKRRQSVSLQ